MTARCPLCAEPAPCLKCVDPPASRFNRAVRFLARDKSGLVVIVGVVAICIMGNW